MSVVLTQLVRRLAAPAVATSLAKEELCLSLAAVAQLRPNFFSSTDAESTATSLCIEALARRSLRVLPSCTPQEVRMIANGANALRWYSVPSLRMTDALARTLHTQLVKMHRGGTTMQASGKFRVRLSDILAVLHLALEAQEYFSPTIHMLATQHAVEVEGRSSALSTAVADEFVAVVCGYLGEQDGVAVVERLVRRLETSVADAQSSPGLDVLRACVRERPLRVASKWTLAYARWMQQRDHLLKTVCTSVETPTAVEAVSGGVMHPREQRKARFRLWQMTLSLLSEKRGVSDDELQWALQAVKIFHIQDPVTVSTLDRAVAARAVSPTLPSTVLTEYENSVYAQAHHYPCALAAFQAKDNALAEAGVSAKEVKGIHISPSSLKGGHALQQISVIRHAYKDVMGGAFVSEKDLFQLSTIVNTSCADEVAMAAYIFARVREVPSTLVMLLSKCLQSLTLEGVVALIRADRDDRQGALGTVLQTCLGDSAHLQECILSASTKVLVELSEALGWPRSRWTAPSDETIALEKQVADMVVAHLLPQVEQMPLSQLLCVMAIGDYRLAEVDDLMVAVCDRVADQLALTEPAPPFALCLEALASLQYGNWRHERLLDRIASAASAHLPHLLELPASADALCFSDVLRFATIQLKYGSPELAAVSTGLLQRVRHGSWDSIPPALLMTAALLALDSSTLLASRTALELPHAVVAYLGAGQRLRGTMTADLAVALVELIERIPAVDSENVQALVISALPIALELPPQVIARLLSVWHRTTGEAPAPTAELSPQLYSTVKAHALGLPPETFTALCTVASRPDFDTVLANHLVDILPRMADALSAHQLSCCVFGLGEMTDAGQRLSHQVMTETLSDYVVDNVELFTSARDIAALLHGFAKLQCTKRNLYSVFASQLLRRPIIATLQFSSISLLFFAFGSVKFVNKDLMDILCRVFVDQVDSLVAADVVMSLRGLSRMSMLNSTFYQRIGKRAAELVDQLPLQAQCDLLHAYGAVEESHAELAATLSKSIAGAVRSLPSVSAATDVLTSLWLMGVDMVSDNDIARIVDHVVQHAGELTGPDIIKLCSITLDQNWNLPGLLDGMAARAIALHKAQQLEATTARAVLDTLSYQLVFHQGARVQLSQLARTVSKEVVLLSEEEQEHLNLITSH